MDNEQLGIITSDVPELSQLPRLATGFYVLVVDEGWPTTASVVLRECLELFGESLNEHVAIVPGPQLLKPLREKYSVESRAEPTLVITDLFPAEYDPQQHGDRGLKISFAAIEDRDLVVDYLRRIAETINEDNFISSMNWFDRRKKLSRVAQKVPVLELFGLLA